MKNGIVYITAMFIIAFTAIGCTSGGIVISEPPPPGDVTLLIANSLAETLSVATRTGGVWSVQKDRLPTGLAPSDILVDGNRAYIVNSFSNSIQVVDTDNLATVREISTGEGTNPLVMALADDGTLWVSLAVTNQLAHIDPASNPALIQVIDLPPPGQFDDEDDSDVNIPWPGGICITGGKLYVAFANLNPSFVAGGAGALGVIDLSSGTVEDLVNVTGRNTGDVYCDDTDATRLYVVSAGDFSSTTSSFLGNGLVEVFDTTISQVTGSVELFGAPFEMVINQKGVAFLTDGMNGDVLRFEKNALIAWPSLDIPDSGLGFNFVSGITIIDDELCVLEFNSDNLYILDALSGEIKETLQVGDGPVAIAVLP